MSSLGESIFYYAYKLDMTTISASNQVPLNPNHINLSKRMYNILGSGGFGQVIAPALPNIKNGLISEYPDNVTKLFYDEDDKQSALKIAEQVPELMGANKGHNVYDYLYKYKKSNLPLSLQTKIGAKIRSGPLFAVRMPNLGVSINRLNTVYKKIREVPIVNIMEQVVKLLSQTANLAEHFYIHGDIRESNVTINPKDGTMTIIDFDWLRPYHKFIETYTFNFYNNPPELLFIPHLDTLRNIVKRPPLTAQQLMYDLDLVTLKDFQRYAINQIKQYNYINENVELQLFRIFSGLSSTIKFLKNKLDKDDNLDLEVLLTTYSIPTFDNFGLGFVLIELFVTLYPAPYGAENELDEVKKSLRARIKTLNNSEIDIYAKGIIEFIDLFRSISHFSMSERPHPQTVHLRAQEILNDIKTKLASMDKMNVNNVKKTRKARSKRAKTRRNH